MPKILWLGAPAPDGWRRALAGSRWAGTPALSPEASPPAVRLVVTATTDPPPAPGGAPWLWLSPRRPEEAALRATVAAGAYDVIALDDPDGVVRLLARLGELVLVAPPLPPTPGLIAESPASQATLRRAFQVARTNMPVLLTGETGSGKEETANLIHRWSGRHGPWIAMNCAAIPNELMESELFGHARGAFSGAVARVDGRLAAAEGGTVFLDEIDDTPMSVQNKLLRVLEDGEITRLGETRPRRVDFRIVAATNRDLAELIARGAFGEDLYERLAIVRLELPPLRDRRDDIPALADHFLSRFYARLGAPQRVHRIQPDALAALCVHDWPGNIRELRNVIYQALVFKVGGEELLLSDLRGLLTRRRGTPGDSLRRGDSRPDVAPVAAATERPWCDRAVLASLLRRGGFDLRATLAELERAALELALEQTGGNAAGAARLLGAVGRGRSRQPGATVRAMRRRLGV